jgi:hypothetical protein
MGSGLHFAITDEQLKRLRAAAGNPDAILALVAELEEAWDAPWLAETENSWDAMHRAFSDGELTYEGGQKHAPLGLVVLGGESLVELDDETVVLLDAPGVVAAAKALEVLTRADFRERYFRLCQDYAPEFGEDDFELTWSNVEEVRTLFRKAAQAGRAVLFSVSS